MTKFIFCFVFGAASCLACGAEFDEEAYKAKAITDLDNASRWLIEEGLLIYSQRGRSGVFRRLLDDFGIQLAGEPWIESTRFIDGFLIAAGAVGHVVMNLHRETAGNELYEFWVVKRSSRAWTNLPYRARFYVVKSSEVFGAREILLESDQFIDQFEIDDEHTIYFPITNLRVLYELEAWKYRDNFLNSDLDEQEIEAIGPNSFAVVE